MTDEVTETEAKESEERDNSFRRDNLHDIQADNASYLFDHLRIKEILTRLDRLEDKAGLEPVEPDVVIVGQPAQAREVYLAENQVLPVFPGPDNSTPQYQEDEAAYRDRVSSVVNKPIGAREEDEPLPSAYDDNVVDLDDEDEDEVEEVAEEKEPENGGQLALFDEQGNLTPEAKGEE